MRARAERREFPASVCRDLRHDTTAESHPNVFSRFHPKDYSASDRRFTALNPFKPQPCSQQADDKEERREMTTTRRIKEALYTAITSGNPGKLPAESRKKSPCSPYFGEKALVEECP
jgi:hypothetical protein